MNNEEFIKLKWSNHVCSFYLPLEEKCFNPDEWLACKYCNETPRVWIFDNGSFAKCCCSGPYEMKGSVRSESIMSVVNRTNGSTAEYTRNNLRDVWNHYVETGIVIELEEGRW